MGGGVGGCGRRRPHVKAEGNDTGQLMLSGDAIWDREPDDGLMQHR